MDPAALSNLLIATIQKQCLDENSAIGKAFSERGIDVLDRNLPKGPEGENFNISFAVTAEQQALLRRNFPGRDIRFTQSNSHSHNYAAAHRLLETDFIYGCFGTVDEPVIDLGGNFVSHLKRRRYNVHSCCPLLDDRDGARFTERMISLKTYYRTHQDEKHEADIASAGSKNVIEKPITSWLSMRRVIYRWRSYARLWPTRVQKNMIMSIMMDPNMLIRDYGEIPNFNVRWEIDHETDTIKFDFIDAPCLGYQHKFSILKQYLTVNAVVVGGTQAFRVERRADLGGVFIVDITAVAGYHKNMTVGGSRSCAWASCVKGKTVVNTAEVVDDWFNKLTKRSCVLIDTKVLTRVLESSFRQFKPTTDPASAIQTMATMLSSSTNYTVINGVTLQAGESLPFSDYVSVATTIYVRTKKMYEAIERNIKKLVEPQLTNIHDVLPAQPDSGFSAHEGLSGFLGNLFMPLPKKVQVDGLKSRRDVYEIEGKSWSEWVKSEAYLFLGRCKVEQDLISDPKLFIPLERVLATKWQGNTTLTVDDLVETMVKRVRIGWRKRGTRDVKFLSLQKLQRNLLTIAKWCENHPTGAMPKGFEKSAALVPEMIDLNEVVESKSPSEAVVNKYASEIQEAITYFKTEMETNDKRLKSVGDHCEWSKKYMRTIWAGDESRGLYIPTRGAWLGPRSVPKGERKGKYERGLTKDGYVLLRWDNEKPNELDYDCKRNLMKYPVIFFDKSCEFAAGLRLIPALEQALGMEAKFSRKLVDGVAGCGKTTKILAEGRLTGDDPDLFLTSNRSSAMELREKLVGSPLIKSQRVRTCDSFLMNGSKVKSKRIIFDECFLQHAGCIYAAATIAEAEELVMFGDTQQIPFVSRIPYMKLRNHKVSADERRAHNMTYRSPAECRRGLSKWFYKKSIRTANRTIRSMMVKPIVSVNQVDNDFDLYITHTQAEKHTLIATGKFGKNKVHTSAEAQGMTERNVAFVRLSRTSISLYTGKDPLMGPCHGLVALSRHTKKFVYFTVADTDAEDLIAKSIRDVNTASDDKVASYIHGDHKL
uniref:Replication protein 1a n=4 Tax=Ilarvirus ApMV TaxID=12319 RepID=G0UDV1_9BROM|nr:methyltransferase [Apple mosaic virus]